MNRIPPRMQKDNFPMFVGFVITTLCMSCVYIGLKYGGAF